MLLAEYRRGNAGHDRNRFVEVVVQWWECEERTGKDGRRGGHDSWKRIIVNVPPVKYERVDIFTQGLELSGSTPSVCAGMSERIFKGRKKGAKSDSISGGLSFEGDEHREPNVYRILEY